MANKKSKYTITFPAFSFEKILLLEQLRKKLGLSAYEVSFMLGKHDFFIRDAENPLKTTLIDSEDSCHLMKVFLVPIEDITPPNMPVDDYQMVVTKEKAEKKKDRFQIDIQNAISSLSTPIVFVEEEKHVELPTVLEISDEQTVRDFIHGLYISGFFNNTRTALEIFDVCREDENFGENFHPRYMIRAIDYYTNRKSGNPILDNSRTNLFSRRLFFKPVDFEISELSGSISKVAIDKGFTSFRKVSEWVCNLDYRRNIDKDNALCLFNEQCGTCSTKHALLKRIADENSNEELQLMLGIFAMNAKNTPAIKDILKKYKLNYIPEAHNYLRAYNYLLDFTGIGINETKFELEILEEIEIQPEQITDYKVSYHRDYLDRWIRENGIPYSLDELWKIREECIKALTLSRLELQTERLSLRPFRKEDGKAMYELNDDPEVLQYTGDVQFENVAAAEVFLEGYNQYVEYGVGRMIVTLKETSEILGWCGLKYHPDPNEYDIGYRFYKKHWGKGYATESAIAAMEDGFARLGMKQILGRARTENTASIRVFEKLNMEFVEEFFEDGENWVLYQINR
ncbi:GNAT family N-acetyltransferase [Sphingobacterium faecale]|uniref:GNAT family N-acetyltransferase n=1 Tax=Sphingobacterium faecale TaxID=2803775 RepID=A0ABS1R5F9_9SPHI|nr:GNAT family N-acetyltransferase [Sphingobacterium faecale]MBL1409237.1 GNAT family N-acetyltransferase [Sphingobacterium faecale]